MFTTVAPAPYEHKRRDIFLACDPLSTNNNRSSPPRPYHPEQGPIDFTSNRYNNVPESFELFLLSDGEKKVTIVPETRVPNASLFKFKKEDHTLANLLRSRLLSSPSVIFAAYKVPHPLFADFELRVQTDGSLSPKEALVRACRDVVQDLDVLGREFTKEWELKRISRMGEGTA